ncbi:MAG: ABC transporter substrate-binding protein [Desulfobacteraceae bacterium]|nr:ABC transporter substrate-binding protein [Desulfobacteraceae bacterium]
MKKNTKLYIVLAIVLLVAVAVVLRLTGTRSTQVLPPPGKEIARPLEKIAIGGHSTIFGAALMAGKELGIYERHGLDASVIPVKSSKQSMAAMLAGELDVVLGTAAAGNLNMMAKSDIFIVADAGRIVPQLVVRKVLVDKSDIQQIADLKGRSVGVPREGSASWYALARILASASLDIGDLNAKYLKQRESLAALKTGDIDAAILSEPYTSVAMKDGSAVLFLEDKLRSIFPGFGQEYAVLYTTRRMLEKPEVLRKFLKAYIETVRIYDRARDHHEPEFSKIVKVVSKYSGVDETIVRSMQWPKIPLDGKPDTAYIDNMLKYFVGKKLVPEAPVLSERINLSYLP